MNAAQARAAWLLFREASNAPLVHEPDFIRAVMTIEIGESRPYAHGDPRVDRWQVARGGTFTTGEYFCPGDLATPAEHEPLAAWAFVPASNVWERPLRRLPAKEPDR